MHIDVLEVWQPKMLLGAMIYMCMLIFKYICKLVEVWKLLEDLGADAISFVLSISMGLFNFNI